MEQSGLGNFATAKSSDASSNICMYSRKGQVVRVGIDIRILSANGEFITVEQSHRASHIDGNCTSRSQHEFFKARIQVVRQMLRESELLAPKTYLTNAITV